MKVGGTIAQFVLKLNGFKKGILKLLGKKYEGKLYLVTINKLT